MFDFAMLGIGIYTWIQILGYVALLLVGGLIAREIIRTIKRD
jgi:hypothetical protein